ncbi:hypothetical protein MUK42_09249 [Musa troglodytarum]|uniref:Uncharacterized protein n=1 Tax=Musa troglodytarum TaxID=320322 RepID=A0A9E7I9E9_9LILI|nr:hypothetical protein MUK42_09249 [Musa troglodytarum]
MSVLLLARPLLPPPYEGGGEQSATVERDVDSNPEAEEKEPEGSEDMQQHGDEVTRSIPFLTPLLLELKNEAPQRSEEENEPEKLERGDTLVMRFYPILLGFPECFLLIRMPFA